MKPREITVNSLQLTLPRTQAPRSRSDADALARSVAGRLSDALRQSDLPQGGTVPHLQIRIPRGQANVEGIARAIRVAIQKPRKES